MKVTLRYFASLRERLGAGDTVDLPDGLTVAEVRAWLRSRDAVHAEALGSDRAIRCALNQVLCSEASVVTDRAELAFFPPVTGG